MSRYFFYNVILVSLLNLMLFVPYLLIQYRYKGAIMSMLCAAIVGTALALLFMHVMKTFPGKGLPEILRLFMPKPLTIPILIVCAVMWLTASSITMYAFSVLINRFFNPDTSSLVVLVFMCLVCMYAATRSTLTVIFVLEVGLIVCVPIIVFLLFKAFNSPMLDWDAIRTVSHYWNRGPQVKPFAASLFVFTGYMNFFMFNRLNSPNFRLRFRWGTPIFCSLILLTSFFIPIGFHGTEGAADYLYIWSVTSDTLIMSYGFIERVIFVFLLMYLMLSLIFAMIGWHMGMEMIKSCLPEKKEAIDPARTPRSNWVIVGLFAVLTVAYAYWFNEKENLKITSHWIVLRACVEIVSVLFVFVLSLFGSGKRKKLVSHENTSHNAASPDGA
ncbi:GerAB/ArcD/ProY family transporter [Paenibacillus glycinis]|uniref:GerAB/ArcD/ProY family transporter n=1 Tax=Paenibacillus glycinis TaxID=2697035 RepID=A0ABW9XU38_9BACL|nr:GerAB/ArcD/ProY family transporter [Paenibacillus glycinis]NBD26061.1 GerAB/ArcD/ProY family transporter [Paenibacillus glycinis]